VIRPTRCRSLPDRLDVCYFMLLVQPFSFAKNRFAIMQSEPDISSDVASGLAGDAGETSGLPLVVDCPQCGAQLTRGRSRTAPIDSCGFETYNIQCGRCDARLVGMIDPVDDTLLVTPA